MNTMECVDSIKANMVSEGWIGPSETGFAYKIGSDGHLLACRHDAVWVQDVIDAIALTAKQMVQQEIERRAANELDNSIAG